MTLVKTPDWYLIVDLSDNFASFNKHSKAVSSHYNVNEIAGSVRRIIGTLRYEDGKARTATAVDAGNFRGSRRVAKNKMLKMCIFAKDGDVNNSNLVQAFHRSNDVH